jgi:GT2 family glycosyltransferase/lipopolysaccharide/colanic/teichoic acid biosynthesis glycosyltransferase
LKNTVDISVIIVNYNVRDLVDNCISSIYKSAAGKFSLEVFLVDNNSIDGSTEHIGAKYPDVVVIENEQNIGFSKANNIALRIAKGEYTLILNPDTLLEENTFEKMYEFCKEHPDAGAVTSKLILANGKLDSACRRSFPKPGVAIPRILGLSKLFPRSKLFSRYNLTYLDENETYEVDAICGAFMFIPSHVFEKTGFFDEDYFMYGEDLDLCFQIRKMGYKIFYYPEVTTIHFKGESTRKTHLSYVNNFYGAMSIFVKKNLSGFSRLLSPLLQAGIYVRSVASYTKRLLRFIFFPLLDAVLLFASYLMAVFLRFNIFPNRDYLFIIAIYIIVWIALLAIFGSYTRKNFLSLPRAFNAIIVGFFVNSSITYFFKEYAFSRGVILVSTVLAVISLLSWRAVYAMYLFFKEKNILLNKINLLIVGEGRLSQNNEDKLNAKFNIIRIDGKNRKRSTADLEETILINNVHDVVFTDESFTNQEVLNLMWKFRNKNVRFRIIPSGKELILSKLNTNSIDEINLIEIEYNINNKMNIFLKRILDIILSFALLLTVYPIATVYSKVKGRSLSRPFSKLLLLPQVFTGKYSLVGYPVWLDQGNNLYIGKKGLTGLIQLNYYESMPDSEMENLNFFYAKNQTFVLDMEILLKTFFLMFKK